MNLNIKCGKIKKMYPTNYEEIYMEMESVDTDFLDQISLEQIICHFGIEQIELEIAVQKHKAINNPVNPDDDELPF